MDKVINYIGCFVSFFISFLPRKKNKIIFGSWMGNGIKDNPKYFYEYLINVLGDNYEYIWITKDLKNTKFDNKSTKVYKYGSLRSIYAIITSGISVFNHGFIDFNKVNLIKGSYQIQLWHGVPWKKIGYDGVKNLEKNSIKFKIIDWYSHYNLYLASSDKYAKQIESAFNVNAHNIIKCGQPRNSILFDKEKCEELKLKYLKKFNKNKTCKIITYMPTFRNIKIEDDVFLIEKELKIIKKNVKDDILIIRKEHFVNKENENSCASVINLPEIESQELLAITDILITDYSSCFFDFLIRDKPIIHYIYDYEYYKNEDRGLYYTIDEVQCGLIAYNKEELVNCLLHIFEVDDANVLRKSAINKYINYETKDSSSILLNCLVEKNILRMEDSN